MDLWSDRENARNIAGWARKKIKKNPYGNFSDGRNLKYTTGCIGNLFAVLSHGALNFAFG